MTWDEYSAGFGSPDGRPVYDTTIDPLLPEISQRLQRLSDTDIAWFEQALEDTRRKWFVAYLFRFIVPVPEPFFAPLIRAAVYEVNPSFNRNFVEPCIRAFGHRRVIEALLVYVEQGTNFEKLEQRTHCIGRRFNYGLLEPSQAIRLNMQHPSHRRHTEH